MIMTQNELKQFYEGLGGRWEGYIQLSDRRIEHIFETPAVLPAWETLHNGVNFIFEACLFDGDRSITIRQLNDAFVVVDAKLSKFLPEQRQVQTYLTEGCRPVLMTQVWELRADELCEGMETLVPTLQLFSGFSHAPKERA